jgi:hypothetical protein
MTELINQQISDHRLDLSLWIEYYTNLVNPFQRTNNVTDERQVERVNQLVPVDKLKDLSRSFSKMKAEIGGIKQNILKLKRPTIRLNSIIDLCNIGFSILGHPVADHISYLDISLVLLYNDNNPKEKSNLSIETTMIITDTQHDNSKYPNIRLKLKDNTKLTITSIEPNLSSLKTEQLMEILSYLDINNDGSGRYDHLRTYITHRIAKHICF